MGINQPQLQRVLLLVFFHFLNRFELVINSNYSSQPTPVFQQKNSKLTNRVAGNRRIAHAPLIFFSKNTGPKLAIGLLTAPSGIPGFVVGCGDSLSQPQCHHYFFPVSLGDYSQ